MSNIAQAIENIKSKRDAAYAKVAEHGGTIPATQDLANLADAIDSIPSGGGGAVVDNKDFAVVDYEGTILGAYTFAELNNLAELPTPTHDGLVFDGWYPTLAEAKANPKKINFIGATYKTQDGNHHLFVEIENDGETFQFSCLNNGNMQVEWGDGATESSIPPYSHTYSSKGRYEIKVSGIIQSLSITDAKSRLAIREIWQGANNTYNYVFASELSYCTNLYGVVPNYTRKPFIYANSLRGTNLKVVLGSTSGAQNYYGSNLEYLCVDSNNYHMYYCGRLKRMSTIGEPSSGGYSSFEYCNKIKYIFVGKVSNFYTGGGGNFNDLWDCDEIHIPSTSVPSLASVSVFTSLKSSCKFYVASGLLASYQSATNWSTLCTQYEFIEE